MTHGTKPKIHQSVQTKLRDLVPAGYNPRRISSEAKSRLQESINHFGLVENLVANKKTGFLVGGHQRFDQLVALFDGDMDAEVPVVWLDLDESDERSLNLALNQEFGKFDQKKVRDLLSGLEKKGKDLANTAMPRRAISEILDRLPKVKDITAKTESVDALSKVPKVFDEGTIESFDGHKIACMDSSDIENVLQVVDEHSVQMVMTDIPYLAGYTRSDSRQGEWTGDSVGGKRHNKRDVGEIINDKISPEEWDALVLRWFDVCRKILTPGGCIFFYIGQASSSHMEDLFKRAEFYLSTRIIWNKRWVGPGRQDFRPQYEMIFYGWPKNQKHRPGRSRGESDVWTIDRVAQSQMIHPTQKPEALYSRAIRNMTNRGELVVDLCGGAGPMLLAAHELGRRSAIFDLNPRYCDGALARYKAMVGGEDGSE